MRKTKYPFAEVKKGKGGFTLVELVVVIAILAIIAAIAIPAVVGIIDNATKTADMTSAKEIDEACMEYKTGIVWGIINAAEHGNSTQSGLPASNADYINKLSAAKAATVQNSLEYAGLTSLSDKVANGSFVYDNQGRIFAQIDRNDLTDKLELTTSLGTLYY